MQILQRVYRIFNLLSIDVVAGAVFSSLYFSVLLGVKPDSYSLIVLGLTVWIIYTADRLLDVRNLPCAATTDRHKFHQRYFNKLWGAIVLGGIFVLILSLLLDRTVLVGGIFLAALICIYLRVQYKLCIKEFIVASLYTAGVLLPSLGLLTRPLASEHYLLIAQFFIVALVNLLLFSWFEYQSDKGSGFSSFVTAYGKELTIRLIWILNFSSTVIAGWVFFHWHTFSTLVFLCMTFILLAISCSPTYFSVNSRYRQLGDAVFFLSLAGILL